MSIEKSDPRLTAYALDELSAEERRAFEAELEQSEGAQHELVEIERTLHELRFEFLDADPVKLESRRRVEIEAAAQTKVRAGRTSRRRKIWGGVSLGAVAASVLLLTMKH
ncbi:MAG TPA: hypothetical protein VFQ35_25495, partial [Polyangiaceae bacterium]|nr:hypothetical protein [Polyangiaceae bacterium]